MTDSTGNVVYSAAHEPYGGIQQTWVTNFDPELKFSGKPRDAESELDYFGARYYDRAQYRFLSVDPIAYSSAVTSPQRWNLYVYCGDNPICYLDPDGKSYLYWFPQLNILQLYTDNGILVGEWDAANFVARGYEPFGNVMREVDGFRYPEDENSWGTPESAYGSWGFLYVVGNDSRVIHSGRDGVEDGFGRSGYEHCTHGCIRTTDDAMYDMWLWNLFDPITYVQTVTIRLGYTPLPAARPLPFNATPPACF